MIVIMLAIAAGPTVATWDCSSSELDSNFQPHGVDVDVADITWNHNGQVLASVTNNANLNSNNTTKKENGPSATHFDPVVLTSVHSQKPLESFRQAWIGKLMGGSSSSSSSNYYYTSISFGVKSRYLCLGDSMGDVQLLDLKKCDVVRQFASTDGLACRQACLDPTESFVFVLTKETLSLFQLREGTLLCKFSVYDDTSGALSFTAFHVSPFRQLPLVVAVGTDQGCVQVLETTSAASTATATTATIPSYEEPTWQPRCTLPAAAAASNRRTPASMTTTTTTTSGGPIVGLAFSAQLKPLLVSISRHGHLSFDDVDLGQRIEQRQVAERVVTCLAYHGDILAIGTDDGRVAIYDIRNLYDPLSTYQMGDAITSLKFAPAGAGAVSAAGGAATGVSVIQDNHNNNNVASSNKGHTSSSGGGESETPTRSNVSPPKMSLPPLPPPLRINKLYGGTTTTSNTVDTVQRDPTEPRYESADIQSQQQQEQQVDLGEVKALIQQEVVRANLLLSGGHREEDANYSHRGLTPSCLSPADLATVRCMIQEEIGMVRDELQQHIQNLHIDMLKEFVRLEEKLEGANQNHRH